MRQLGVADFDAWDPLNCAFQVEEGWPVTSTVEERRTWFQSGANRPWWGAFEGDRLVAIVCLNAAYGPAGQVGSLYTVPDRRRRGIARSLMRALMNSMRDRMELRETVLFASEENGAARAFYDSMGFETRGHFGLLFGSRAAG
jgi:ribosomal protein S18 acetylase RimI-like enzyme